MQVILIYEKKYVINNVICSKIPKSQKLQKMSEITEMRRACNYESIDKQIIINYVLFYKNEVIKSHN